jgi:hypothetical protein
VAKEAQRENSAKEYKIFSTNEIEKRRHNNEDALCDPWIEAPGNEPRTGKEAGGKGHKGDSDEKQKFV